MTTAKTQPRTDPMKSGAIIYVRVSTAEQVENNSLENQRAACLAYCRQNDLEVLQVFSDEGYSAKIRARPALLQSLDFCKLNKEKVGPLEDLWVRKKG